MKKGNCHLCDVFKELSFENIPPKAAFNERPILIQKHNHLFDKKLCLWKINKEQ